MVDMPMVDIRFRFIQQVKDGIAKIQAHKRRFAIRKGKHRRDSSFGSTTFTDGESDSEDESEFCGSGEWAEQGVSGGLVAGSGKAKERKEVDSRLCIVWCVCVCFFFPFRAVLVRGVFACLACFAED